MLFWRRLSGIGLCGPGPDQVQQGLVLAQELAHPPSLEVARSYVARVHQLRREAPTAYAHTAAARAIAEEQGFAQRVAGNTIMQGWVLSMQGRVEEGIPQMTQGIAAFRATGAEAWCHYWLGLLAEACGKAGQSEQGLTSLAEALTLVWQNGECFYEAELHRLTGEFLLQQPIPAIHQVLTCFHCTRGGSSSGSEMVGAAGRHEPQPPVAATRETCGGPGPPGTGLRLVHRGLRYRRPPGGEGVARRAGG